MLSKNIKNDSKQKNITSIRIVSSVAELRKTEPNYASEIIFVSGYYEDTPFQGGGYFLYDINNTNLDDSGINIRTRSGSCWRRTDDFSSGLNAQIFGVLDTGEDITEQLNNATKYALINNIELVLPRGYLRVDGVWKCNGEGFRCRGQGSNNTFVFGTNVSANSPIFLIKNKNWDINSDPALCRLHGLKLSDFCFTGKIEGNKEQSSCRDALSLHGIGFDFELSSLNFYNIGCRAIVAEDLWDGDIHNCKFHECGQCLPWETDDDYYQALVFKRKYDSCNAIRITNCHFEHLKRGAIYIEDYCYSFFLTNNKFEAINQDQRYKEEYPIYIGNNHRCFTMSGGFITLTQQNKNMHYIRGGGDIIRIDNVSFIAPQNKDGAAVLNLSTGRFKVGAIISSHFDIRGDLQVEPLLIKGDADFRGSTIKCFRPLRNLEKNERMINNASFIYDIN
ncbi:hypothetical protein V4B65_07130 [Klebsiella quasipneumoniae]|uniref:hypothetical protein n=1 Tax=Klebsiella quasipneumoniae TaxID=1463165 RepID=UPI000E2B6CCD|nr:hypothetical protein [Klebsiella quasipneumoniae]MCD9997437.1 hypothetical protein [Klebsiella quasipneumoniae subsp. similipneumoniae]VVJ26297.1 Uncharacterised protein [Klebsiella quasipneumoniae]HBV4431191.1 hypothetical protein [Klebsiella quasipneumoniae]HDK6618972.1 hypothetical protein [Klebsiella quasipneumoniae]